MQLKTNILISHNFYTICKDFFFFFSNVNVSHTSIHLIKIIIKENFIYLFFPKFIRIFICFVVAKFIIIFILVYESIILIVFSYTLLNKYFWTIGYFQWKWILFYRWIVALFRYVFIQNTQLFIFLDVHKK